MRISDIDIPDVLKRDGRVPAAMDGRDEQRRRTNDLENGRDHDDGTGIQPLIQRIDDFKRLRRRPALAVSARSYIDIVLVRLLENNALAV